jgi:hypothetical protein
MGPGLRRGLYKKTWLAWPQIVHGTWRGTAIAWGKVSAVSRFNRVNVAGHPPHDANGRRASSADPVAVESALLRWEAEKRSTRPEVHRVQKEVVAIGEEEPRPIGVQASEAVPGDGAASHHEFRPGRQIETASVL